MTPIKQEERIAPVLVQGGTRDSRKEAAMRIASDLSGIDRIRMENHVDANVIEGISIDDVREAASWLGNMPGSAKRRCVLFLSPHMMRTEAQNAMLKTLEEPPGLSCIVLTAPHAGSLLKTIVSRCRTVILPWPGRPDANDEAESVWKQCDDFARLGNPAIFSALQGGKMDKETAKAAVSMLRNRILGLSPRISGRDLHNASVITAEALARISLGVSPSLVIGTMCVRLARTGCLLEGTPR